MSIGCFTSCLNYLVDINRTEMKTNIDLTDNPFLRNIDLKIIAFTVNKAYLRDSSLLHIFLIKKLRIPLLKFWAETFLLVF